MIHMMPEPLESAEQRVSVYYLRGETDADCDALKDLCEKCVIAECWVDEEVPNPSGFNYWVWCETIPTLLTLLDARGDTDVLVHQPRAQGGDA
jgi:hypothetical protein